MFVYVYISVHVCKCVHIHVHRHQPLVQMIITGLGAETHGKVVEGTLALPWPLLLHPKCERVPCPCCARAGCWGGLRVWNVGA